jgi:hypothetical protein
MRRPVMYLAGLLLATGASLALAGPASAAPAHPGKCHHDTSADGYWGPNGYVGPDGGDYTSITSTRTNVNSGNSWSLLALSGVLGNGGNIGSTGLGL